jgi:catechol 2,3-dioxygenase-like lactoylglutathione lyase family enzyme
MKLNAVGVTASNITKSVEFYTLLGFQFSSFKPEDDHVESIPDADSAKLMIDSVKLATELIGEAPTHSNHSGFALEYDIPTEIDEIVSKIEAAGFKIAKEPWDAFWGQRYAVVIDPEGYLVDLYCRL